MKPQVLHRKASWKFFIKKMYRRYSAPVSAVELWSKIQKQLKNILLKDLSANKIKTAATNFYFKSY